MISWLPRVPVRLSATAVSIGVCSALVVGVATAPAQQTGPPVNGAPPLIKGKTHDGANVKATPGDWSGAKASYAYSWERCNASGAECETIAGAATNKYRLTPTDVGHRLVAVVNASNGEGSGEARSAPSAVIAAVAPKHKGRVAPTGEAVDGRVLSVTNGTWRGTPPFTYTYQWLRCGKGCTPIAGATKSTYRATTEDIGNKLRATITAKNEAGSASQRSKPTSKVVAGSPLNIALPRVAGTPLVGQTLTAEDGTWVGTPPIAFTYQWYACSLSGCEPIAGETEPTHTVVIGEFGDGFEVEVTAKNAQGTASAISEESSIAGGNVPVNTEAPTVSGEAKEGQLLTAASGKWAGTEPITFEYEWLRCNTSGAECTQAAGASLLPTYLVAAADVGHTLRVKVIAKNLAGTGEAESEPTGDGRRDRARERDRAARRGPRDHGADAERDGRHVDGHRADHLHLPLAAVQQSRHRMCGHRRRERIEIQNRERRRGPHAARGRHGEKRRRDERKGIGDDDRSARCRADQHRSARQSRAKPKKASC